MGPPVRTTSEPEEAPANRSSGRGTVLAALLTLVIGLAATFVAASAVRDAANDDAAARFDSDASLAVSSVETEVASYFDRLRDVGAFVSVNGTASDEDMASFVERTRIFSQLDPVLGVFVLQIVPESELEGFLATFREQNPDFAVADVIPPFHRPGEDYLLLTYYIPGRVDLALPRGTNVENFESVAALIEASRDREVSVAGSFQNDPVLPQIAAETDFPLLDELLALDFFIGLPVRIDPPGDAPAPARPDAWVGATIGDFDTVLAEGTANSPVDLGVGLTLDLTDTGYGDRADLSRAAIREGSAGPPEGASFLRTESFTVDGVDWRLTLWAGPDAARTPPAVFVILAVGVIASVMAAAIVAQRRRARIRERTLKDALMDRAQFQQDILESVTDAMVVLDGSGRIVRGNPAWDDLCLGLATRPERDHHAATEPDGYLEVLAASIRSEAASLRTAIGAVLSGNEDLIERDIALEEGSRRRWFAVRATPLRGRQGGAVVLHTDITERKRSQDELELKASHDPLTGLLNREAFESEVDTALAQARVAGTFVAVIFVDLDGFKPINDTHGHAVGDDVLRAVAQRIGGAVRTSDRVARLGGDEFVALISPIVDPTVAETTAERIRRTLGAPIHVGDLDLTVMASLGVALAEAPLGGSHHDLIEQADQAMYASKQGGGNAVTVAR